MSVLGYTFDIERIIRKYLVLMGSWLRSDILVLFIELFRVHTNQPANIFSLSLLKLHILLPSVCCLWNKQNFCSFPLLFLFPFFFVCIRYNLFHPKQNASIFLNRVVKPMTLYHMAQNTKFCSRSWNFKVIRSNAYGRDTYLDDHFLSK